MSNRLPATWRVVVDADEAKHAVGGAWALHLGRGSPQGKRDEWWLTLERDGEVALARERLLVGAGASPWAAVAERLAER